MLTRKGPGEDKEAVRALQAHHREHINASHDRSQANPRKETDKAPWDTTMCASPQGSAPRFW